jgi:hypothetical protein
MFSESSFDALFASICSEPFRSEFVVVLGPVAQTGGPSERSLVIQLAFAFLNSVMTYRKYIVICGAGMLSMTADQHRT